MTFPKKKTMRFQWKNITWFVSSMDTLEYNAKNAAL